MLIERPFALLRKFFPDTIWIKPQNAKTVYLTFDDGPTPDVTPHVLDILERYKVKATFFCVGENVHNNPDLYADILRRGHKTGNHTYNHLKGFNLSVDEYIDNVLKAEKLIENNLFRPPYGRITFKQLKALRPHFDIVMWDLITRDYTPKVSPKQILNSVENLARNGSIIVFHDSLKAKHNVLTSLPFVIESLQQKGYRLDIL